MTDKARKLGEQPAFPLRLTPDTNEYSRGMTIHQQFAKAAMQGWLASFTTTADPNKSQAAIFATEMADALCEALAAREL